MRQAIEKPVVRMWLFGMITLIEMYFVRRIRELGPEERWPSLVAAGRLRRAGNFRMSVGAAVSLWN